MLNSYRTPPGDDPGGSAYCCAENFATVSSTHTKDRLNECGVGDDHIFNSSHSDFVKGIVRIIDGRGVDVVVNTLVAKICGRPGPTSPPSAFGRFFELGKKNFLANEELYMKQDSGYSNGNSQVPIETVTGVRQWWPHHSRWCYQRPNVLLMAR